MIRHLAKETILAIHLAVMKRHDDLDQSGVKYPDRLEAALERPKTKLFGEEQFPSVLEKACCYYHSIATTHIFYNGNKRTALTAFVVFLDIHGLSLGLSESELEDYTVRLTTKEQYKTNDCIRIMVDELKPHVTAREIMHNE